jgi:hypothetical protein
MAGMLTYLLAKEAPELYVQVADNNRLDLAKTAVPTSKPQQHFAKTLPHNGAIYTHCPIMQSVLSSAPEAEKLGALLFFNTTLSKTRATPN